MDQLERPEELTWDERRLWFEAEEARYSQNGASKLSEQACALMIDLQATFCAGAWAAVVILAATIVEAQLRVDSDIPAGLGRDDLRWLRGLRNQLVHEDPTAPVFTLEDQWTKRDLWQKDARRAVTTALALYYQD
ncbi:MAG: hypothetical protein AAF495_24980 [Pseudomonadota bacterium]